MGICKKKEWMRTISKFLTLVMVLSVILPSGMIRAYAAEALTQGDWTYTNSGTNDTATFGSLGLTYYSPSTGMTAGTSGGKDYVKSTNSNGKADATKKIVLKTGSYMEYVAPEDGVLTVYIGKAAGKAAYVSKDVEGTEVSIGTFEPCGAAAVNEDGFVVTQGTTWATVDVDVEKGVAYHFTVSGSKMLCYGGEFAPNAVVTGTITDPYSVSSYGIKLTNVETEKVYNATVKGNAYSVSVKPGKYTITLTGENAVAYAVTADTNQVEVVASTTGTANTVNHDITFGENSALTISGKLTGFAEGYALSDLKLSFVPKDTATYQTVQVEVKGNDYEAMLISDVEYTLKMSGAYDYEIDGDVIVVMDATAITKDIAFKLVPTYDVSGSFLGLGDTRGNYVKLNAQPTAIKFTNVEDKYSYTGVAEAGKYSAKLRNGAYLAEITCEGYSTSTHVIVENGAVTRDLLLKELSKKEVAYSATIYVGADKAYKTVQAAVDAVAAMTRANNENVTIMIDPGTYREQVIVTVPNITLESNGGDRSNTKITWYYGIGYQYYSCVNSEYSPYADYDQYEKGDVISYWGSAVITKAGATGFKAKNITFENSFNKYMTEEELADGVAPNGREAINLVRKANTRVDAKSNTTERAAAYVNYADKVEFLNCAFIGSQDTLYTCNVNYDSYYKNCYIEGQTDFIYGNGDVIFDACEINLCGYSDNASAGYLTANSCSADKENTNATDGYIFRNCYVTYNTTRKVTPSYLGRMWGKNAKVAFINTSLQDADMIIAAGWGAMSGVEPTSAGVTLVEYNTMYNGQAAVTSGRVKPVVTSIDSAKYSVESVFINKGWTPTYYEAVEASAAEFATNPAITSNNDINKPNPGETLTVSYELGSAWAKNDVSLISWYAVSEGYDNTSLDTILKSATLLYSTTAANGRSYQIPMDCAGKYIMVSVTPIAVGSATGVVKYAMLAELPVSNTWIDPSNPGSIAPGSGINIYLAGDSTVKDYSALGMYNGGKILSAGSWGEYLQNFFDSNYVTVIDYAQGGRSVRSFLNEGKLDSILKDIKAGDYLMVQFGHNDSSNGAAYYLDRFVPLYTAANPATSKSSGFPVVKPVESMLTATPSSLTSITASKYYSWDCGATYKGYMQYYIDKALEKGAIPVIVTPVSRMYYTADGAIKPHHDSTATDYAPTSTLLTENNAYVTACKELYEENKDKGVLFIDAFAMTEKMFTDAYAECGKDTLGAAVMDSGEKTHSNKTGGVIQAGLIAKDIKDANISISQYVVKPAEVYGEETTGEFIFTIDKNGVFTAKDKKLEAQPFWTTYGQNIFDSLGKTNPTDDGPKVPVGKVYLVGDSTVCEFNDNYYYPRYGYGTQLNKYLDGTCEVVNLALSGRSSKSFLGEANYKTLCDNITKGDVLIIGFGHNDEKDEVARYTNPNGDYKTEGSFAESLYTNYIKMAQEKGAEVILCTPICRRNPDGTLSDANKHITATKVTDGVTYPGGDYAAAIKKLGADVNVPVIDLTKMTADLYNSIGAAETLYMHAWASNKEASVDNTHLNIYGAKKIAYMLASAIKTAKATNLAGHVVLGTEPTKEKDLVSNPNYVATSYDNNLKDSELWPVYKDIFKGTVFGDVGGASKITKANYTLETTADGAMRIKVAGVGKITSSVEGLAMYYYRIPANSQFTLTATATINTLNANSQAAFGLMARDDMYIDKYDTAIASDSVVAGTLGTGVNCFNRKSGSFNKGPALTVETLAEGKSYDLSIVSNSDGYACKFGNEETQTGGFDFKLVTIDSDYVYVGMFANRGMDVSFSNIVLTVDGKEIINTSGKAPVGDKKSGLCQDEDGVWRYYVDDKFVEYNGFVANEAGWWCVANGQVAFDYTGLWSDEVVGWWYVENGMINFNYNGLVANEAGWWCVAGGRVAFEYTGLWSDPVVGWWYVENGMINFAYNGLVFYNDAWWCVAGGQVAFGYTGLWSDPIVGWWYVENGMINFGYNGLVPNEAGWWCVAGGQVAFGYTGLWYDEVVGWWYVENGMINFAHIGSVDYNGGAYWVQNGQVIF